MIEQGKKNVLELEYLTIEYNVKKILEEIYECKRESWLKGIFHD